MGLDEYQVRHGFQALYDVAFSLNFISKAINTGLPAVRIKDSHHKGAFLVSLDHGEKTLDSSKLLDDDESVEVCHVPRLIFDDKGKKIKDISGWKAAHVESADDVRHAGNNLLRVFPPR